MISVVIPTLNAEDGLAACLTALVPAAVQGIVREVIVVDGGSNDRTLKIIEQSGAELLRSGPGRGEQLSVGAAHANSPWLLFLHADTVLEPGWEREVSALVERIDSGRRRPTAAAFRFALDDDGFRPRMIEAGVATRCALFRLPYGDQGLLISRQLYQQIGGYSRLPLMEDVDIVRRIGRRRMTVLRTRAVTSAVRYQQGGYVRRSVRNLSCLTLYFLRVPTRIIARLYS
jgi:rSAM/selenodomain-associated transferase 2